MPLKLSPILVKPPNIANDTEWATCMITIQGSHSGCRVLANKIMFRALRYTDNLDREARALVPPIVLPHLCGTRERWA